MPRHRPRARRGRDLLLLPELRRRDGIDGVPRPRVAERLRREHPRSSLTSAVAMPIFSNEATRGRTQAKPPNETDDRRPIETKTSGGIMPAKRTSKRKRYGAAAGRKVKAAMRERKRGTLRSGRSRKRVKSRKQ